MPVYKINTSNTSFLTNGEELVYAGKNGFISILGAVPILCNSYTANASSIVFSTPNLHLLTDDNYQTHILNVPALEGIGTSYVHVPYSQYPVSSALEGSIGYNEQTSTLSLEIQSFNLQSNTITVANKQYDDGVVSAAFLTTPFYITLYQTLNTNNFSNRSAFISGSQRTVRRENNVEGVSGSYTMSLGAIPESANFISVYLDDIPTQSFTWSSNTISTTLTGTTSKLKTVVNLYTVPAIEPKDTVSLSAFNNVFTVTNVSYLSSDVFYNAALTSNKQYKVKLNKALTANVSGSSIVNVSADLVGKCANINPTYFTIDTPGSYPFTYRLANTGIYYIYQKNKVKLTTAKLDEFGRLPGVSPTNYIVTATNINRFNRASSTVQSLVQVPSLTLTKVTEITIEERVFVDTTGGASINALVTFPTIANRDITHYELQYYVVTSGGTQLPGGSISLPHSDDLTSLSYTLTGLNRGRIAGSNTLIVTVTPMIGSYRGFPTRKLHPIVGKQSNPSGIRNLSVVQQDTFLLFSWQYVLTTEGFVLDLDTKEVEIRQYPGIVDLNSEESIRAAWGFSTVIGRVAFPNTTFSNPINSFDEYTYLLRVRDTSDIESNEIAASALTIDRPTTVRVFKTYNDFSPGTSFVTQDGVALPTANQHPELSFTSFSEGINGGLVLFDSSNTDNSNGSAVGFSAFGNTSYLTTATNSFAEYITPIRDLGRIISGTVRITTALSASTPGLTYGSFYNLIVSGVTDFHGSAGLTPSANVLVDNAFGGIGTLLGFNNANAATVSYNSFHQTLTSGGALGNVYAIRNPGQFTGDTSNANSYALIAGVINANAIAIGNVYFANGQLSSGNNFANVAISGNSYELINLVQYGDPGAAVTFLGPEKSIVQNIFVRYATSNVFYAANANGVVGYPGHGNTNGNAFVGATNNAELGWKSYVPGLNEFQYFQIKLQINNPSPDSTEIILQDLKYEIDTPQKTFRKKVQVAAEEGITVDYSYVNFYEIPQVSAVVVDSDVSQFAQVFDINTSNCKVKVFLSQSGNLSDNANVSVIAVGG
jgi:hypothetical protein